MQGLDSWSEMEAGEVKRGVGRLLLYWVVVVLSVADTRIKSHAEQQAEQQRRAEQTRLYRRNQIFGLLMVAAVICAWWLFHTNPKWIFTTGWWRW